MQGSRQKGLSIIHLIRNYPRSTLFQDTDC